MARAPEAVTGGRASGRIVSVSTALFDGYPIAQAIDEIARAGAAHVEPAFIRGYVDFTEGDFGAAPAARLRRLIHDAGLAVHAVSAHMDLSLPDASAMLERRIGFAAALDARVLITNAGPATQAAAIEGVIAGGLPRLEDWGGMLAIENPGHGAGDFVGSAREGRVLVDAIASPHVRLNHDAGNVHTYSRETLRPADDYAAAADVIGHVHLKDVKRSDKGWAFVAVGEGDVGLAAYLAAIPSDLPLSLELPLRLTRPGCGDPVRQTEPLAMADLRSALARSFDFLRAAGG